jgi:hypothetical protein
VTGSKPYPPSFEAGSVLAKSRGRERERERSEARDAESGAGMSGGAGALRRAGRAPSPRAAIVQTKDTNGPNYGNTSP